MQDNIYIIGEIGQAHEGSIGMAHAYIDALAFAAWMQQSSKCTLRMQKAVSTSPSETTVICTIIQEWIIGAEWNSPNWNGRH